MRDGQTCASPAPRRPRRSRARPSDGGLTIGPTRDFDRRTVGATAGRMLVDCRAHRLEMRRRRAAAAADDARAGIDRQPRVVRHQVGRSGIVDVLADELRDAAVRFGDEGDRPGSPRSSAPGHRAGRQRRRRNLRPSRAAPRGDRRTRAADRPAKGPSWCGRQCRSSR